MSEVKTTQSGSWLFLAALAFIFLGIAGNPIFLAVCVFFLAAAEYQRNKLTGVVGAVAALVLLFLMLGYGIGKDLALRDNARAVAERPANAL